MTIDYISVSEKEYELVKADCIKKFASARYCYIPAFEYSVDRLIEVARRSNHLLSKTSQVYGAGAKKFYMLRFRRMKVMVEMIQGKTYATLYLPHKVERTFRLIVLKTMCSRHVDLNKHFKKNLNTEEVYKLMDKWAMYQKMKEDPLVAQMNITFKEFLIKHKQRAR